MYRSCSTLISRYRNMPPQRPTTKPSTPASPYTPTAPQPKAKETLKQREKEPGSKSPLSSVMDRVETVYLDDPGRIRHLKLKQALDVVYGSYKNREGSWTYVKREDVAATRARRYLRLPRLSPELLDPETTEPRRGASSSPRSNTTTDSTFERMGKLLMRRTQERQGRPLRWATTNGNASGGSI